MVLIFCCSIRSCKRLAAVREGRCSHRWMSCTVASSPGLHHWGPHSLPAMGGTHSPPQALSASAGLRVDTPGPHEVQGPTTLHPARHRSLQRGRQLPHLRHPHPVPMMEACWPLSPTSVTGSGAGVDPGMLRMLLQVSAAVWHNFHQPHLQCTAQPFDWP